MLTTLLNPTLWLIAAVGVSAAHAVRHGRDARHALDRVVRGATTTPALVLLVLLAAGGLASRVVLGFLSPGAYAEEVLGARAFLEGGSPYGGDDRRVLAEVLAEAPAPLDPWTLPGITPCQGSAFTDRARFYTSQGHVPTMLLASVPVVTLLGGQGLYVTIVLASLAALLVAAAGLVRAGAIAPRSRLALLVLAVLAGWQPVLAAVRQGEALVVACALSVVAWTMVRRGAGRAGIAGGAAAMMTLPALVLVPALLRSRLRAGLVAGATVAAGAAATMAVGGWTIFQDFVGLLAPSADTYAQAANNYAIVGRALAAGPGAVLAILAVAAVVSTWRGRSDDLACASWLSLGLLAAPIVWSQHLTLALVPLVVLLARVRQSRSAWPLLAWSAIAAIISAPDPLVARLHGVVETISPAAASLPVVSAALLAQWTWVVAGRDAGELRRARAA